MSELLVEKPVSVTVNWLKLPWALLWFLPALSIVAGLITVFIAVRYGDSMVKDDYYRQGLAYNAQQKADETAADYRLQAVIVVVGEQKSNQESKQENQQTANQHLLVTVSAEQLPALPDHLLLSLSHPTDHKADQTVKVIRQGPQQYGAELPSLRDSNWYVQLQPEDGSWRLRGRWHAASAGQLKPEIL